MLRKHPTKDYKQPKYKPSTRSNNNNKLSLTLLTIETNFLLYPLENKIKVQQRKTGDDLLRIRREPRLHLHIRHSLRRYML